jgi:hypothetical protein
MRRHEAEEELARLVAAHDGDVRVGDGGVLVYVFPELMVSAHGRVAEKAPDPAWRRLEVPLSVTGNSGAGNFAIGAVNGFNLIAAATAPLFIFPRLGLGGAGAWIGLVWVPLVFSTMFFGIPLFRSLGVRAENRKRSERNLRRLMLSQIFRASLVGDGAQPVTAASIIAGLKTLAKKPLSASEVEKELDRLTADWDADVSATASGQTEYRFASIRGEFSAAEQVRRALALEQQKVGEIVYSSADTPTEESQRDARAFDRQLAEGATRPALEAGDTLAGYLPSTERIGYIDDFELVAFDEELKRRPAVSVSR